MRHAGRRHESQNVSFRILGVIFRKPVIGLTDTSGDPVRVSADAPYHPTQKNAAAVYVTKPFHTTGTEQSLGMTPDQARRVAALMMDAADWCDQKSNGA